MTPPPPETALLLSAFRPPCLLEALCDSHRLIGQQRGVERWECLPSSSCWRCHIASFSMNASSFLSLWSALPSFYQCFSSLSLLSFLWCSLYARTASWVGLPPAVLAIGWSIPDEPIKTIKYFFDQVMNLLLSVGQPPGGSVFQFVPNLLFRAMWDHVCDTEQSPESDFIMTTVSHMHIWVNLTTKWPGHISPQN